MRHLKMARSRGSIAAAAAGFALTMVLSAVSMETALATPGSGVITVESARVRSSANGTATASAFEGQAVSILGEDEGSDGNTWYEISFTKNGAEVTGWVRSDLIDTTGATEITEVAGNTDISYNDKNYVLSSVPDGGWPEGFERSYITYNGETYEALKLTKGDLFLVYLVDEDYEEPEEEPKGEEESEDEEEAADGEEAAEEDAGGGSYYIFDDDRDEVKPFVLREAGSGFVVLSDVPTAVKSSVSDAYEQTECAIDGVNITAYAGTEAGGEDSAEMNLTDYYFLYGVSDQGTGGWYLYDIVEDTLQRSVINMSYTPEEEDVSDTSEESAGEEDNIIGGLNLMELALIVIALILLILFIVFAVRSRRLKLDCEDYEDELSRVPEKYRYYGDMGEESDGESEDKPGKKEKREKKEAKADAESGDEDLFEDTIKKYREDATLEGGEKIGEAAQTDSELQDLENALIREVLPQEGKSRRANPRFENSDKYEKKTGRGTLEVELPGEKIDLMDLDDEEEKDLSPGREMSRQEREDPADERELRELEERLKKAFMESEEKKKRSEK